MCEDAPCCGCCGPEPMAYESELHPDDQPRGWAGDGSGEDDLADHNANEADDYRNEGLEDQHLDGMGEE